MEPRQVAELVARARERIRSRIRTTPVEDSPVLGRRCRAAVHLKLENLQRTGSFKLRGVLSFLTAREREARNGVVAASSGNHGLALAWAAREMGLEATVVVPRGASPGKLRGIRALGAEVLERGEDCVLAEAAARELADGSGRLYVSPYNDPLVLAGQGTLAPELLEQLGDLDTLLVALGGGGLLSGIAGYLRVHRPGVEIVACSPARSPVMQASVEAGEIVEMESGPTLSDATAGGVEPGAVTFQLCRRLVDRFVTLSETEIAAALRLVLESHHTLIEGAAALPVAALLQEPERYRGQRVAAVLCGANISLETLREVLRA